MNHALDASAHESAHLHVSGRATYIDDLPVLPGTLHAAFGLSPVAHGRIRGINLDAVRAAPGVVTVLTAQDIPGANKIGIITHDEPLLADGMVEHVGQPVFIVAATSHEAARKAAKLAQWDIETLPAVFDARQAQAQSLAVAMPRDLSRGTPDAVLQASARVVRGSMSIGGQEHFYLEGQVAYAQPRADGTLLLHSSTQHPSEMQQLSAKLLGLQANQIEVQCRRMGGGFGGKESQSHFFALGAALLAMRLNRPVKLRADRDDDFMITGKRHAFEIDYAASFDAQGVLTAARYDHIVKCGFSADYSAAVADRAVFHADNAYFVPQVRCTSYRAKTNTQSATAFRGFGGPQGMMGIETALDDIATALGKDPLDIRLANLYGKTTNNVTAYGTTIKDNVLPTLMRELEATSNYRARRAAIRAWNAASPIYKKGLALTPVIFGVAFGATLLNQGGALVQCYLDGTVLVNHGGTEMGQGLHTKVLQVVANELGLPLSVVRISATDTTKVPNTPSTAASSGADLNCMAAWQACQTLKSRLQSVVSAALAQEPSTVRFFEGRIGTDAKSLSFTEACRATFAAQISLSATGFYRVPDIGYDFATMQGRPFYYYAYGAAASEVIIDTLTGESKVTRVDILHDVGRSLNPALDRGQIEGAFVQGMGWLTTEELVWDANGALRTHAPSTYKIPVASDVPANLRVALFDNANVEDTIYKSKAVGEPPFMLALSVFYALRDAIASVADHRVAPKLDAPATAERILFAVEALKRA